MILPLPKITSTKIPEAHLRLRGFTLAASGIHTCGFGDLLSISKNILTAQLKNKDDLYFLRFSNFCIAGLLKDALILDKTNIAASSNGDVVAPDDFGCRVLQVNLITLD